MKQILIAVMLATTTTATNAQISFGPAFGLLSSNYSGKLDGSSVKETAKVGINAGAALNIGLANNFFLQTGLQYVMNGWTLSIPGGKEKVTINTLELPVLVAYKFGAPDKDGFFVAAGPYFGFNIGGKAVVNDSYYGNQSETLHMGNDSTKDAMRTLDLGVRACLGYGIRSGFFVFAHYQKGLANLVPQGNSDNKMYNRNFGVTAGYLFSAKRKKQAVTKNVNPQH